MSSTAATQQTPLNAQRSGEQQPTNDPITAAEQILVDWWAIPTKSENKAAGWGQISNWCHGAWRYARSLDTEDGRAQANVFDFANAIARERAMLEI